MPRGTIVHHPLARLTRDFENLGPLGASMEPWMTAELDQHAAEVCASIAAGGSSLTERSLSHYLHGFMEGCLERGWYSDSVDYDWETLRILAICRLAGEHGFVR